MPEVMRVEIEGSVKAGARQARLPQQWEPVLRTPYAAPGCVAKSRPPFWICAICRNFVNDGTQFHEKRALRVSQLRRKGMPQIVKI